MKAFLKSCIPPALQLTVSKASILGLLAAWGVLANAVALTGLHAVGFVALLFVLLVPGYLLVKFMARTSSPWVTLVLSVCLSIAILMFTGLALNLTLPYIHHLQPLTRAPVLLGIDVVTVLLLGAVALTKRVDLSMRIGLRPVLGALGVTMLPLLVAAGAIRLTNGGSNSVTILAILVMAVIAALVALRGKFSENTRLAVLYSLAVSALFLWALRGYHLPNSSDVGVEYFAANLTYHGGFWSMENFRNAYNACLSITILPTMLSQVSHYSIEWLYKLWYPLIFALSAPTLHLYFKHVVRSSMAFLAAFFFASQTIFIFWMPMLARQEIALLFFAATMLVIFGGLHMSKRVQTSLLLILFAALIISHYSTAYIALFVMSIALLVDFLLRHYKIKSTRLPSELPSFTFLLVALLVTFLWQMQITASGNGLVKVLGNTVSALTGSNNEAFRSASAGKLFTLNPFVAASDSTMQSLENYKQSIPRDPHFADGQKYAAAETYTGDIGLAQLPSRHAPAWLGTLTGGVNVVTSLALRLALFVGCVIAFLKVRRREEASYAAMVVGFVACLGLIVAFPYISNEYNLERLYQTSLIVLAPLVITGTLAIGRLARHALAPRILTVGLLILFFFYNAGLMTQIGGGTPSALLNNWGYNYDRNYTLSSQVGAVKWLHDTAGRAVISVDPASARNLLAYGNTDAVRTSLLPTSITQDAYVYLSKANQVDGVVYQSYEGNPFLYRTPLQFLQDQKNRIYSNEQNGIYR